MRECLKTVYAYEFDNLDEMGHIPLSSKITEWEVNNPNNPRYLKDTVKNLPTKKTGSSGFTGRFKPTWKEEMIHFYRILQK